MEYGHGTRVHHGIFVSWLRMLKSIFPRRLKAISEKIPDKPKIIFPWGMILSLIIVQC